MGTFREMSECVGRDKRQPCPAKRSARAASPDREGKRSKEQEPDGAIKRFMEEVQLEKVTSQLERIW